MLEFTVSDQVAVIALDDGKANAVDHDFVDAVNEGLDRALEEAQAVLMIGREGVFSAGFDLKEFEKDPEATAALVNRGADMLLRVSGNTCELADAAVIKDAALNLNKHRPKLPARLGRQELELRRISSR